MGRRVGGPSVPVIGSEFYSLRVLFALDRALQKLKGNSSSFDRQRDRSSPQRRRPCEVIIGTWERVGKPSANQPAVFIWPPDNGTVATNAFARLRRLPIAIPSIWSVVPMIRNEGKSWTRTTIPGTTSWTHGAGWRPNSDRRKNMQKHLRSDMQQVTPS